jgi:hypothetical protein
MDQDQALQALEDAEVVPCFAAPIAEAKELLEACLEKDIPALLDRGACCGSSGCGCAPKLELLVRPDDVSRVSQLLRARWHHLLEREGTVESWGSAADAETDPPCPACGHVGPLAEGACGGCGLQLG